MPNNSTPSSSPTLPTLKILPAYTGLNTVEEILQIPRARRLLWLEILLNDQLDLKTWQDHPEVRDAYHKVCQWFTTYRSLIQSVLPRVSLPLDSGKIDQRDYRTFAEALAGVTKNLLPPVVFPLDSGKSISQNAEILEKCCVSRPSPFLKRD